MQQMVKCLRTEGRPETVPEHLESLFPWFEVQPQEDMEKRSSPRIFKSHRSARYNVYYVYGLSPSSLRNNKHTHSE